MAISSTTSGIQQAQQNRSESGEQSTRGLVLHDPPPATVYLAPAKTGELNDRLQDHLIVPLSLFRPVPLPGSRTSGKSLLEQFQGPPPKQKTLAERPSDSVRKKMLSPSEFGTYKDLVDKAKE